MLVFFVPYIFSHAVHGVLLGRYCVPVNWMAMLIVIYGWFMIWGLINRIGRIPLAIVTAFEGLAVIIVFTWAFMLLDISDDIASFSERSASMPFTAIGAVLLLVIAGVFLEVPRRIWREYHYFCYDELFYYLKSISTW